MLRALTLGVLATLLATSGAAARQAGGTPVAYVAVGDGSLVAVELTSARVVGRVVVPAGPEAVAAFYDDRRQRDFLLVTSPAAGALSLIDAVSRRVIRVWRGLGRPRDVDVEGLYAYVTDERGGRLLVLDLRSRRIVGRVDVGAGAQAVAVSDVALVTHGRARRTLTLVNVGRPNAPAVLYRLVQRAAPRDVAEQPDSANAFLTFWGSGRIAGLDWGIRRVRFSRAVAAEAGTVTFDVFAGDRLWVADPRAGRLVLVSARDGSIRRRVAGCPGARKVVQGGTAWIAATCGRAGTLAVWDTTRWHRRLVPLAGEPRGAAVAVLP